MLGGEGMLSIYEVTYKGGVASMAGILGPGSVICVEGDYFQRGPGPIRGWMCGFQFWSRLITASGQCNLGRVLLLYNLNSSARVHGHTYPLTSHDTETAA